MSGVAPGREVPVVDMHAHHVGDDALARIVDQGESHGVTVIPQQVGPMRLSIGGRTTGLPVLKDLSDVNARLNHMDRAGIDIQLVAPWMDLAGYHLAEADGLWLARLQNDALAALTRQAPGRFLAAAAVPLQSPEAAAAELRRAVLDLGHRAVQIGARVEETGLDDKMLDPFWDAAEELGVPVIVHPAELGVPDRISRLFLQILVGNPAETTYAAAALLLGGVLERHPGLRVVLVHGGGFLPYQMGRLERGYAAAPQRSRSPARRSPAKQLGQLYFDTVVHDDAALAFLANFAGGDHLVLGTDYPFPMRDADPLRSLDALAALHDRRVRRQITSTTAVRLLGGVEPGRVTPESPRSRSALPV